MGKRVLNKAASMPRCLLTLTVFALMTLGVLYAQDGLDPQQQMGTTGTSQGSQSGNCQDPNSATCTPQSASPDGSYGDQNPSGNGAGATSQAGPNSGLPSGQGLGSGNGTGYQQLNSPNYRDQNALPNQAQYRGYGYRTVPPQPLTEFQKFVASTTGQVLPIYGARLFRQVPTTFAPVDQIPVPADATVGPGDMLRIRIWGQVNFSADLRVDRGGEIYLPQVGPVHVAGLPYSDLDDHLRTSIGRVYKNFQVSAQLGQIRSIQVYVMGRAQRPGTYTVSSLSTLIDALFASGGPALDGSLRHIQLKRGGTTVTDLDLYQLLVRGDKSGDVKLQPGDVIFIPSVGPQVAVLGSVKTPAIYEERESSDTVQALIDNAAGVTNVAGNSGWSVERIVNRDGRTVQRIAFTPAGLATEVGDGDILRVEPAIPSYRNIITLRGNTANPGRYTWHPGMTLADLFPDRSALLTRNYWWQRTKEGLPAPEFERVPSLERLVQPNEAWSLPLSPQDQERIRQQRQRQQQQYQQALQERQLAQPGSTGGQALQSGGLSGQGSQNDLGLGLSDSGAAGLSGLDANGGYGSSSNQSQPYDSPNGDASATFGLEGGPESATAARRDVRTENTANAQGVTRVTLPAPEIDWDYAVIERLDPETLKTSLIPFDLGRLVMGHDAAQNLQLQPGDTITVFSQADIHVPVEQQTRYVRLEGEFLHSGVYSVRPGETLRDLVQRAGGFAPGAYLFGSEFTRVSVQAVQQRRLDEYVQQLQLQIERGILATSASAVSSAADLASASTAGNEARELVARLRQIRATGRIVLNLHAFSQSVDDLPPLNLEDGDAFYIPSIPSNVSVIGAVYDQNSFIYHKGDRLQAYVQLAGGANRNADKHHPFLIRADGSVVSQDQVGEKKFRSIVIQAGDTIVVSEKTFGPNKLRAFLDFSQLFSQLSLGAAVLTTVL